MEWKEIDGFAGRYEVSSGGDVRSMLTGRVLSPGRQGRGYMSVLLYDGSSPKKPKSCLVHRLVAAAFIGPEPEGHQVNHISGDKSDNRVENLEYVTPRENMAHAEAHSIGPRRRRGSSNTNSKLVESDVRTIKMLLNRGMMGLAELARAYKVDPRVIAGIRDGIYWAHVEAA